MTMIIRSLLFVCLMPTKFLFTHKSTVKSTKSKIKLTTLPNDHIEYMQNVSHATYSHTENNFAQAKQQRVRNKKLLRLTLRLLKYSFLWKNGRVKMLIITLFRFEPLWYLVLFKIILLSVLLICMHFACFDLCSTNFVPY